MSRNNSSQEQIKQPLVSRTESKTAKYESPPLKTICGLDANLIALSSMNFFQNAAVSIIVPFFPPIAKDIGVTSTMIGLILSFNPIGSFLTSLIVGQMMGRLGKKNLMIWGLIFQSISIASFGALSNLKNDKVFIILSATSRFIQGAARSAYGSSSFGYVPQLWPDSVQKKISIMETLTALGTILGPILGQVMYTGLGNQMPFYILSFLFMCCLITIRWLPPDIKSKKDLDKVSSLKCLSNRYIFFTFMVLVAGLTAASYINTLYTEHMENLGLNDDISGYVYPLGSVFYIACLHLMPRISKYVNRKLILLTGVLIASIGVEIQAPEKYFGLPSGDNLWYIVTIGQCVTNVAFAMTILPIIPELIELILNKELKERNMLVADAKLTRACSDMSSGIFMAGYSLGLFLGPFVSGLLYDSFNGDDIEKFMNTSRCIAAFVASIFILYLTVGGAYRGFKQQQRLTRAQSKRAQSYSQHAIKVTKQEALEYSQMTQENKASQIVSSEQVKNDENLIKVENVETNLAANQVTAKDFDALSDTLLSDSGDDDYERGDHDEVLSEGRHSDHENDEQINFNMKQDSEDD
ncbi:MFS transporter (macronuclear) [Tetrahymena thermophila SB210]|uniref:MFS transporter n=1 Tax=Tetrahymena thermophila (strain SB210) TaxID=312017 RepID=Q23JQ0_TETTS|nr:MFS transporter [Tetrahymena thermophila SB210]EAR96693.2 MFS transporter [Tetrahymena thermophila SB210]|eukprot:XP_001016938.2 MFS transporter [Tetrahymena thermophila SB210]